MTTGRGLAQLEALQEELSREVRIIPLKTEPGLVAGVDAWYHDRMIRAGVSVFSWPDKNLICRVSAEAPEEFPYVPGFLSFRELPAITRALKKLPERPDLILVDGHGIAHPRGIGIASHLGVNLGIPAIGCAKSRLVGEHEEPKPERGSWEPLRYNGTIVGAVLRTRRGVKPVFVSPGHLVSLEDSLRFVLGFCEKFRIPEPLREANRISRH